MKGRLRNAWYELRHWHLFAAAWALLPDNCEMPNCSRSGVRGNENRIPGKTRYVVMCDNCSHHVDSVMNQMTVQQLRDKLAECKGTDLVFAWVDGDRYPVIEVDNTGDPSEGFIDLNVEVA